MVPVCLGVEPAALAAWSDRLQGLAASAEHPHAFAEAGPSEALIRRVAEAAGRWHKTERLKWTIGSAALVLLLLAVATVAATINGRRLAAVATDAQQQKDQLALQQVQLQGEIASAAATLESTKQSLRETAKLSEMAMCRSAVTGMPAAPQTVAMRACTSSVYGVTRPTRSMLLRLKSSR